MSSNPEFWSVVGFWILMIGLVRDLILIFIPSGRAEKTLAAVFTLMILVGVAVEHVADTKRFAPRDLSEEQQKLLVSKLKPFAGQKVDFVNKYAAESEPANIARQIEDVLRNAEWSVEKTTGIASVNDPETRGVAVGTASQTDPSSQHAARILAEALGKYLEVTAPSPSDTAFFGLREPIRIIVGRKQLAQRSSSTSDATDRSLRREGAKESTGCDV
jgi:hypothetical protein